MYTKVSILVVVMVVTFIATSFATIRRAGIRRRRATTASPTAETEGRHPIILVPGNWGSEIETRTYHVRNPPQCARHSNEYDYRIWMDPKNFQNENVECWAQYSKLYFDERTNRTENLPGVETRIPYGDDLKVISQFGPVNGPNEKYFKTIIDKAKEWGYEAGKDILGAPYDFRKAPNEAERYFFNLQMKIELAYVTSGRKVVLLAYDMGSLYTLYFLNQRDQEWKTTYIKAFITLAAPWYGTVEVLNQYVRDGMWNSNGVRDMFRSFPSAAFLMPSQGEFGTNDILATINGKAYTTSSYEELYRDIGYPNGWKLRKLVASLLEDLKSPGVEVHCIIANGTDTPEKYEFTFQSINEATSEPMITYADGDGIVLTRSAQGCFKWQRNLGAKFHSIYVQSKHKDILHNDRVIQYIKNVVNA